MEKIYFYKLCQDNGEPMLELCRGYRFDYGHLAFGISKLEHEWSATEISTGLSAKVHAKRLKDIPEAFKKCEEEGRFQQLEDIVFSEDEHILWAQEFVHKGVRQAIDEQLKSLFKH